MDEKDKKNLEKHALEGAAAEGIQRYGEAVKEHVVAYKGDPIKNKERNIKLEKMPWKLRRKDKKTDKYRSLHKSYKKNPKQGAGFAAEIKAVAKENAEHIIKGEKKRIERAENIEKQAYKNGNQIGGTNDKLYDVVEVDVNRQKAIGEARQLKYLGKDGKECADTLLGKDFDKYRDNNIPIEIPKEFYAEAENTLNNRIAKLNKNIKEAQKNGDILKEKDYKKTLDKAKDTLQCIKKGKASKEEAINAVLHPKLETAKDIAKVANRAGLHQAAIGGAMAGGMSIIKNVAACLKNEKTPQEAAQDVAKETGTAAAGSYLTAFLGSSIQGIMRNSANAYTRGIAQTAFPLMLVSSVKSIGELSISYFRGAITGPEFAGNLLQQGINELGSGMFNTLFMGVAGGAQSTALNVVAGMAGSTVGYMAAVALYEQVKGAIDEYQIAVEKRKQIETQCAEAVELICQYREEMNAKVERYFTEHLTTFNEGFMAMDKAIVENDINGFVSGNVKIQELLGHEIQFRNEEEFEDLMLSDVSLKL